VDEHHGAHDGLAQGRRERQRQRHALEREERVARLRGLVGGVIEVDEARVVSADLVGRERGAWEGERVNERLQGREQCSCDARDIVAVAMADAAVVAASASITPTLSRPAAVMVLREGGVMRNPQCHVTWKRALALQSPNQSTTHRLNRAGLVAARLPKSAEAGFIVKTT